MSEIEKADSDRFWNEIIRNPDGSINEEQLFKELYDFRRAMDSVSSVYMHITGGRLSKILYEPGVVTSEADEYYQRLYEEDLEEEKKDARAKAQDEMVVSARVSFEGWAGGDEVIAEIECIAEELKAK